MTPQEIFDKALVAVLKQGEPALNASGGCDYWPGTGKMCAVGHLIGEDLAKEWSAAKLGEITEVEDFSNLTFPDWVSDNLELLVNIQDAHDIFIHVDPDTGMTAKVDLEYWRNEFIRKMRLAATRHKLEYKEELEHI